MRRLISILVLGFLCLAPLTGCSPGGSGGVATDELPASLQPRGFVNDFAGVLSDSRQRQLEMRLREVEQKTGAEVAVVSVADLQGGELEDFAVRLFERWGIGKKGEDNGLLLLIVTEPRRARLEVGYGLEPAIPDARAGRILDESVMPYLDKGRGGEAMVRGGEALARIVADEAGVKLTGAPEPSARSSRPASRSQDGGFGLLDLIWLIILIPIFIRHPWLLLLFLSGGRGGGGGGGFSGGGFGGFGGGLSGGGGASR